MTTRILGRACGPYSLIQRTVCAALCLAAAPAPVCAQRVSAAQAVIASPAPPAASREPGASADDTRGQLDELLRDHPPGVREVLQREPTLLTNTEYLAPYPRLAAFLVAHPQISRSPGYFLGEPSPQDQQDAGWLWRELLGSISVGVVMLGLALGFGWLVRTALDHRRWQRVSKVQVDTHSKLLDRMTSSEDLRAYMESPAGRQFLESAPIALDGRTSPIAAPVSRILWSMQAGVVALFLGFALQFVSRGVVDDAAQPLRVLGVLVAAIGAALIVSAALSYALSRRLGLIRHADRATLDNSPLV